jgi:hypothetical protein
MFSSEMNNVIVQGASNGLVPQGPRLVHVFMEGKLDKNRFSPSTVVHLLLFSPDVLSFPFVFQGWCNGSC